MTHSSTPLTVTSTVMGAGTNSPLRCLCSRSNWFPSWVHGVLVRLHGFGDHTVEPRHLLIDQLQSLELQGQHLPMHGLHSSRQSIDQLLLRSLQPLIS